MARAVTALGPMGDASFAISLTEVVAAFVCLCVGVALWRQEQPGRIRMMVIWALGATAVHLMAMAGGAIEHQMVVLVEVVRNILWLTLLQALFAADGRHASLRPVGPLILALALAELTQIPLVVLSGIFPQVEAQAMIVQLSAIFHLLFSIGMLVLVHNLYAGAGAQQRRRVGWMVFALVVGWGFQLNFYAVLYLAGGVPTAMAAGHALAWAVVAVLLWVDSRQKGARTFSPSRSVTFQSLSLLVIAVYLTALFTVDELVTQLNLNLGAINRFGAIALTVVVAALLASPHLRGLVREVIVRNLFRHRYDYREEWLRLSRTMGGAVGESRPLEQRVVEALAEIVDSPAGLLLMPTEDDTVALAARWNWRTLDVPAQAMHREALSAMRGRDAIALDPMRSGQSDVDPALVPRWLIDEPRSWVMVPLPIESRVVGVVVLARPAYARQLDWEDHDLLRIVGRHLAAHLSEHLAQKALLDAARFDEFNRRMAFVMHDIKNLASQLGLLVSNADRHIEKPAFRADMLLTLRSATERLETLLGRLSHYGSHRMSALEPVDVFACVQGALSAEIASGLIELAQCDEESVRADRDALDQVVRHLMRNGIEASEPGKPVAVGLCKSGSLIGIEIVDKGCGMSAEFVGQTLFKPFVSTKADGFGIGAFEARELVRAMGGRLEVESREGAGSRFVVWLPRAETEETKQLPDSAEHRKVA